VAAGRSATGAGLGATGELGFVLGLKAVVGARFHLGLRALDLTFAFLGACHFA
jgi:hypothetical protein